MCIQDSQPTASWMPDYTPQLISVVVFASKTRISLIRQSEPSMYTRGVVRVGSHLCEH